MRADFVEVEMFVKVDVREIAKLTPEQAEAFLGGIAKVLTAGKPKAAGEERVG